MDKQPPSSNADINKATKKAGRKPREREDETWGMREIFEGEGADATRFKAELPTIEQVPVATTTAEVATAKITAALASIRAAAGCMLTLA